MINKFSSFIPAALLATGVALSANVMPADAFGINMVNVTNNNPEKVDVASQLKVEAVQLGTSQVRFNISNIGNIASSITDIYFGKGSNFSSLLSFATAVRNPEVGLIESSGVNFGVGANPNEPQGGIKWESAFSADSEPGRGGGIMGNGINNFAGSGTLETLGVVFNLVNGATFADVEKGFKNNSLALAFHVQSIGTTGKSDWFGSNTSVTPVPEPFTILGTGAAIGFAGLFRREQSKRQNKSKVKS